MGSCVSSNSSSHSLGRGEEESLSFTCVDGVDLSTNVTLKLDRSVAVNLVNSNKTWWPKRRLFRSTINGGERIRVAASSRDHQWATWQDEHFHVVFGIKQSGGCRFLTRPGGKNLAMDKATEDFHDTLPIQKSDPRLFRLVRDHQANHSYFLHENTELYVGMKKPFPKILRKARLRLVDEKTKVAWDITHVS